MAEETKKSAEENKQSAEKPSQDVKADAPKSKAQDEKKPEAKPKVSVKKKDFAVVNASNVPMSTKESMAICKFVKGKPIDVAIADLEQVMVLKKPVPMKGEIPHRHGPGIMSGRFPVRAAQNFISALKTLSGNALHNELENPIIVEAIANIGKRPYGRFGRVRKKRTHLKIVAKPSEINKAKKKSKSKK